MAARPKVLVSNDDGIEAPGIRALVQELANANICDVYVCAPSVEHTAQSHAITMSPYISCAPVEVPGAKLAFTVEGTPADSVMLALHSPLLGNGEFDLVVSGINRGHNCGLRVIYSGTVAAAREAACKGSPAIALSWANGRAHDQADFAHSATLSVSVVKAALGLLPSQQSSTPPFKALAGAVVSVNFPKGLAGGEEAPLQGFHLTHQSQECLFPTWKEVKEKPGPRLQEIDERTPRGRRMFHNMYRCAQKDESAGGDAWAVKHGWVSVCPLGLLQDLMHHWPATSQGASASNCNGTASTQHHAWADRVIQATCTIIELAAADAGVSAPGLPSAPN